jgi:hypothetical protein
VEGALDAFEGLMTSIRGQTRELQSGISVADDKSARALETASASQAQALELGRLLEEAYSTIESSNLKIKALTDGAGDGGGGAESALATALVSLNVP